MAEALRSFCGCKIRALGGDLMIAREHGEEGAEAGFMSASLLEK